MGSRILPERDMEIHPAASRMCQAESGSVRNGKASLQG